MTISERLTSITVGSDPEVMVMDKRGTVTSAIGKVGGSKASPRECKGGALQEDNVMAEFNTNPASSAQEFVNTINTVMGELTAVLAPHGLEPSIISSHEFNLEDLRAEGAQAMEFGCGGEWDGWTGRKLQKPNGGLSGLRTAGGHVHVGYFDPWRNGNLSLARMLDVVLGVPSVLLDQDTRRRSLYGSAGSMRHKPYGMEYRTLSNFWLKSDELKRWVFERAVWAGHNLPELENMLQEFSPEAVKATINNGDVEMAMCICSELKLEVP
jgi:hypothetical protein